MLAKHQVAFKVAFFGDVSRKFCYCVKIEASNKILAKKVLYKKNIK